MAPPEVEVAPQDVIPSFEVPLYDDFGNPVIDFVLAQDQIAWWSQGEIVDRRLEHIGITDAAVVAFRHLLDEQMKIVEAGGDPICTFRDEAAMPAIIRSKPYIYDWETIGDSVALRGFGSQSDRYGPLNAQVLALWDRIAEHYGRERETARV
jgi:5,5'-dehydrodivanillate O-demethylase